MKNSLHSLIVAASAALLLNQTASAMPVYEAHRCDHCSTPQQMQGIALQNGLGTRYVFSVTRAEIRKFHVERWCGDNPQGTPDDGRNVDVKPDEQTTCTWWHHVVLEDAVEPELTDFVYRMREAYLAYGNSFYGYEVVHISELAPYLGRTEEINAYSFVRNSDIQTRVLRPLNDILDQRNNPHIIMNLIKPSFSLQHEGMGVNFAQQDRSGLRTRVTFSDGSEVHAEIRNNRAVYEPGSARDANGALIPDYSHRPGGANEPHLIGDHNTSDGNGWIEWAHLLGIPVVVQGGSSRIQCGTVNGGPIQCIRMP